VPVAPASIGGTAAERLVGLLDHRVVRGVGVATAGVGVAAVAAVGVTARRRGVATLGVGVVVASAMVPTAAGVALTLLLGLRFGVGVAVELLRVPGVGVSAVAARRFGVAAGRGRAALLHSRLVALRGARAGLRMTLTAAAVRGTAGRFIDLLGDRVVGRFGITAGGVGVAAVAAVGVTARRRGVATIGVGVTADRDGNRVAVPDLGVACVGFPAFTAGGGGGAAGRRRIALRHFAGVGLTGGFRQRHRGTGRGSSDQQGDHGCDHSHWPSHV
jgi:hypothetical protein